MMTNNWKGKNVKPVIHKNPAVLPSAAAGGGGGGGYKPPSLNDLQSQNRMKARKYYHPKKKFNNNNNNPNPNTNRFAPYAPRNTTSFIIRAKKSGGIASLVSPCPVTPAVLPTPIFSPSREVLGDMAKEEWGVDGYGSMKGLIRLRSSPTGDGGNEEEEDEEGNGSSESDVEEHVEVERRFEMIYPNYGEYGGAAGYSNVLENRVDDQDSHIAQLEEENLTLKERLFLMEREVGDLRRRLQFLERQQQQPGHGGRSGGVAAVEDTNEEVVEDVSENESDGGSDVAGASLSGSGGVGAMNTDVDVCMEDAGVHDDGKGEVSKGTTVKEEDSFVPQNTVSKEVQGRLLQEQGSGMLVVTGWRSR
ncbi:hypothetical protein Tsubulata_002046 [Turnera subulata]|uniref:PRLI-interacting factor A n=1 Tax=Turnera subulata TaxID=218843 RepID=A0A9Q0G1G2_9ROSI|nr:hypothetical protein Tsubulata_002046 [Turnera subulata]